MGRESLWSFFFFFFFTRQGQGRMLRLGSWHLEDDVPRMVWSVENMLDAASLGLNGPV